MMNSEVLLQDSMMGNVQRSNSNFDTHVISNQKREKYLNNLGIEGSQIVPESPSTFD